MSTSQILLYNAALRECGETKIADLSDSAERRHILDDVYDGTLAWCLEQGQWNFALRTVQIDSDTGTTLEFGWDYAFSKPSDWVRTAMLSADENFSAPLEEYKDQGAAWLANVDPLYLDYVSNGEAFGGDLTLWPASYTRFVELELASRICHALTQSQQRKEKLEQMAKRARRDALTKDALNEAQPRRPFRSSWVASRGGGSSGDRGSRGSLTG